MFIKYGKTTRKAVSIVSYLAQRYDPSDAGWVSSLEIAKARDLPKALVAKLLTIMAQSRLVVGVPGPNGGYRLGRDPGKITIYDVIVHFEQVREESVCPFGPNWCGNQAPCPLHDKILKLQGQWLEFIHESHFGEFVGFEGGAGVV
jgi:Rrf2 family iron-sulfur cluster assembly transcriptional regulator